MSRQKTLASADEVIDQATLYCMKHKHRLTRPRLEVLRILAMCPKPLGAYEILHKLGKVLQAPKPPTAYRAIDFWVQSGFVHRIESLNAYILCHASHRHTGSQFMICEDCGSVTEANTCDLPGILKKAASAHHFNFSSWKIEIHGSCGDCCASRGESLTGISN